MDCPNFQMIEVKKARFGSSVYKLCRGSQRETWGGYAKKVDLRPKVSGKVLDPNWRGRFSGGSRKDRNLAKGKITKAEMKGDIDSDREEFVGATQKARKQIRDARQRANARKFQAYRDQALGDPHVWPCAYCYVFHPVTQEKMDCLNLGTMPRCYKCNRLKPPHPGSAEFEDTRWMCTVCSTEEYTISGIYYNCPDCWEEFDPEVNLWHFRKQKPVLAKASKALGFTLTEPSAPVDAQGGSHRRRPGKRRGGKRHKKQQPSEPCLEPAAGADEVDEESFESDDDETVRRPRAKPRMNRHSTSRSLRLQPPTATRTLITAGLLLSSMPTGVEGTGMDVQVSAATGAIVALMAAVIMTIRRTYEAADSVIGAVENVTIHFVHEVGEESVKIVPLLIGIFITQIVKVCRT